MHSLTPTIKFWHWVFILLLALLPWGALLLEETQLEPLFANGAYWILTAYMLGLLSILGLVLQQKREPMLSFFQQRYRLLTGSLVVALLLSVMVVTSHDVFFKTLSDETNLLSVSRSLLTQKKAYNVTEGVYYYQNFNISNQTLPKRPLLFPYLTHLLHIASGYDWQHPFWLNRIALLTLLWTLILTLGLRGQPGLGVGAALIVVSSPLFSIQANSAGFDFFSLCWLWFAVFLLALGMGKIWPGQHSSRLILYFGLWWAIGFVQIRYENAYLTLGAISYYLFVHRPGLSKCFWVGSTKELLGKASILIMGSWLLALSQWQVSLNSNKFVERADQTLFSVEHFPRNLKELVGALIHQESWNDQITLPYRPLVWLTLAVGMIWGLEVLWRNHPDLWLTLRKFIKKQWRHCWTTGWDQTVAAKLTLLAFILAQQLLYLLHFFGRATHPSSARFFLGLTLIGSLGLLALLQKFLPAQYRPVGILLVGTFLCLLYLPQSQQGRFINQLLLNRETQHVYEVVLANPRRDILYIHDRPGQIVVLERGAVSIERASRELENYQQNLRQGLIQELFYLRKTDTPKNKDEQLMAKGDWLEVERFMVNAQQELIVLQHRKLLAAD